MSLIDQGANAFFTDDHRMCDEAWATLEAALSDGDGKRAVALWADFDAKMKRHLAMEEEVLFPALEDATGMHNVGPVAVMRHEHGQMRGLLSEMGRLNGLGEFESVLNQGDTLLMLISQHNAKEEGILYPMADEALGDQWEALAGRLKAM